MSAENCEIALRAAAAELQSLLEPIGFCFQVAEAGHAHHPFASGFFVGKKMKIGLIFRVDDNFGAVVYENEETSVSHDDLMSWRGLASKQRLRYVASSMKSVDEDGGSAIDAFRADLEALDSILRRQNSFCHEITRARRDADRRNEAAAAAKAAKLQAWSQRRVDKRK